MCGGTGNAPGTHVQELFVETDDKTPVPDVGGVQVERQFETNGLKAPYFHFKKLKHKRFQHGGPT